jgi:hypothetical protein
MTFMPVQRPLNPPQGDFCSNGDRLKMKFAVIVEREGVYPQRVSRGISSYLAKKRNKAELPNPSGLNKSPF